MRLPQSGCDLKSPTVNMPGESDTSVLALLAGARYAPEADGQNVSLATPTRTDEPMAVVTTLAEARVAVIPRPPRRSA